MPVDTELLRAFLKQHWTFILKPGFQQDEDDYFQLNLQEWVLESEGDQSTWQTLNSNMWQNPKKKAKKKKKKLIKVDQRNIIKGLKKKRNPALIACKRHLANRDFSKVPSTVVASAYLHPLDSLSWLKVRIYLIFALSFFCPAAGAEVNMTSPFYRLSPHRCVQGTPKKTCNLACPVQTPLKTSLVSSPYLIDWASFHHRLCAHLMIINRCTHACMHQCG